MSSSSLCKKCNSNEIEVDRARGITYCTNCGDVLEESIIVSEIQIEEGSGGGFNVIGQFVGTNDTRGRSINGLQNSLRESKEITLQNGKRLINEMGSKLRLNQHCLDTGYGFYRQAVHLGLTRGRKIRQVIAACLYLVCRTEKTPHMLLDLCDIVLDDACYISSLGKLAMKFAFLLCIKLPEIDPGLFIPRFAQKLDFGDKTHEVTTTAMRLVQRMNRDWMATGRRPSGLCGAALLVSARMYDFHRSLDDIVKVVKIGKTTLRKRMLEFEDTPSSNLTVDEFHSIDLEEEHDPPAYTRSRKFAKIKQIEEMVNIQEIEKEIIQLQENIEAALSELHKPRGLMAKYSKICQIENEILGPNKDVTNVETEIQEAEEFLSEEQINIIRSIVDPVRDQIPATSSAKSPNPMTSASLDLNSTSLSSSASLSASKLPISSVDEEKWNNLRPTLRSLGFARTSNSKQDDDDDYDEDDELRDGEEEDEDTKNSENEIVSKEFENDKKEENSSLLDNKTDNTQVESVGNHISKTSYDLKLIKENENVVDSISNKTDHKASSSTSVSMPVESIESVNVAERKKSVEEIKDDDLDSDENDLIDGELDLTGIDDDEIDSMLLSRDEIKTKAKLWLRANKDWLKDQKVREDQKRKEMEKSKTIESKPKKPRLRKPKNLAPVSNPQEAIERMLQEKKLSSKINYDVLNNLNKDSKKPSTLSSEPSTTIT